MNICILGYGGHSYVAIETLLLSNFKVKTYCDLNKKIINPFDLSYIGREIDLNFDIFSQYSFFLGIGDNLNRKISYQLIAEKNGLFVKAIHPNSFVSKKSHIGIGTLIVAGAVINVLTKIGNGVICNSNCVVEHGSEIGDFSHIGPGAVICGDVKIGECSFIGAGSVIKQGLVIGSNVTIGAGSVVLCDIPDNSTFVGSPAKKINKR